MFILMPPSEGKSDAEGVQSVTELVPELVTDAKGVQKQLRRLDVATKRKWYGARNDEIAALAHKKNLAALDSGGLKALERYTGVVFAHLDYPTLRAKKRAEQRLLIVSAMWGLIPGGTPIPDYKLPINPTLAKYWRPLNSARLAELAKGKPVLSLLPQAYAKAVDYEPLIFVNFKVAGGKKSAGHFGKAIKGKFVRYLIENNITSPDGFSGFKEDGYQFDGSDFIAK